MDPHGDPEIVIINGYIGKPIGRSSRPAIVILGESWIRIHMESKLRIRIKLGRNCRKQRSDRQLIKITIGFYFYIF